MREKPQAELRFGVAKGGWGGGEAKQGGYCSLLQLEIANN